MTLYLKIFRKSKESRKMYLSEEIAEIRIAYVIGSPIGFAVRATGLVRKGADYDSWFRIFGHFFTF